MATTARRLAQSNKTRNEALQNAKTKKDSGPADMPISPDVIIRLDNIAPDYKAAMTNVTVKKAELSIKIAAKAVAARKARKFVSYFIQTFNNGIELEIFPKQHRAYYNLEVESGKVPYLGSEQALKTVGQALIAGDPNRVAAGGAAMAIPDIASLTAAFSAWFSLFTECSNLKDALDTAQENVAALNEEADGVILKVWDQVETFYNEEDKESQRANAREWGVVYITVGSVKSTVNVELKDINTGDQLAGEVYLDGPDLTIVVDETGLANVTTNFIGDTNATAQADEYNDNTKSTSITEGSTINLVFEMVPIT